MKSLSQLLSPLMVEEIIGSDDKIITDVVSDSRKVTTGSLFVAVRGTTVDGHSFIPLLQYSGVAAIVCEEFPEFIESSITYIKVSDSAVALGYLASEWWDNPSRKLNLVGVTGTNGKTTTATLIYEMARLMGYKAGLLSTVCNYVEDEAIPTNQTTPDPLTINALLHRMVEAGCEAYLVAKKSFFDGLPSTAFALTNIDDKVGEVMVQNTKARKYTYSLRSRADFTGRIIESRLDGTTMSFNGRDVEVLFTGKFNAYNLTAVYGVSILLGWPLEEVLVGMSRLVPVAGRFQAFHSPKGYTAIVDYAHTPDAVVNVLQAIREVIGNRGSIITVVGAGGNRDKGKRPIMAREAALRSDRLILTSDNPRFEEPGDILRDMEEGLDIEGRKKSLSIVDRREAIRAAAAFAQPGDVILIAGKGHEDYQEIKGVKHHFDDREVVKEVFACES